MRAQPVHKGSRHMACLNIWSHTHKHVGLFLVPCCTLSLGCLILLSMTKYVNFNFLQQTLTQIFQHLKMHSIFMTPKSIEKRFDSIQLMALLCQPLVKLWMWLALDSRVQKYKFEKNTCCTLADLLAQQSLAW